MRQSSDVHERVLAELFARAQGRSRTTPRSTKTAKVELLLARTARSRACCTRRTRDYSRDTNRELADPAQRRATIRERYGARAIRNYIISHTETVSDLLEVLLLQKETGLLRGTLADERGCDADGRSRCSRPSPTCAARPPSWASRWRCRGVDDADRSTRADAGSHARLLGLEQGRRLPHVELGAVPGRDCGW